ncbi:MAG: amidohydrolase family protein [Acidobacteria bacterium]|nr:amidohydrolase family protein [Acidobacteriota bacterium]
MKIGAFCLLVLTTAAAFPQDGSLQIDPQLLAHINTTPAIDNHTHVEKVTGPGEKDTEFDALPCPENEPALTPAMARSDIPELFSAWHALYGYNFRDFSPQHLAELAASKQQVRQREGDNFPAWALDQFRTSIMFANRINMGRGLTAPRFRWVPYDDALMYPLNNDGLKAENPDRRFFFGREETILKSYIQQSGLSAVPDTLDGYLKQVVTPTLERQKHAGAVAIKFEMAYLRSLEVRRVDEAAAARAYESLHSRSLTGADTPAYQELQDYILAYLAGEAGRLGLALHFHTGFGCGSYFKLAGANPLLLEELLDNPELRKTTFVLIHGGWPWSGEMATLLTKPNVYTDTSEQSWLLPAATFAPVLRLLLEFAPEKVMFGTDLYGADEPIGAEGGNPGVSVGWEDVGWIAGRRVRNALAMALSGMVRDGEVTPARAREIASLVLNGNASKLYGLIP